MKITCGIIAPKALLSTTAQKAKDTEVNPDTPEDLAFYKEVQQRVPSLYIFNANIKSVIKNVKADYYYVALADKLSEVPRRLPSSHKDGTQNYDLPKGEYYFLADEELIYWIDLDEDEGMYYWASVERAHLDPKKVALIPIKKPSVATKPTTEDLIALKDFVEYAENLGKTDLAPELRKQVTGIKNDKLRQAVMQAIETDCKFVHIKDLISQFNK